MPELPEVETVRCGILPHCYQKLITDVKIYQHQLRWPIPVTLPKILVGQCILGVERRGKYILLQLERGTLLWHLGMSGVLRVFEQALPSQKHDHVDIFFGETLLRYRDVRRFGALLWHEGPDVSAHPLLASLGPEPLSEAFSSDYLYAILRSRQAPIKTILMNANIVVGVGNIYANEALFAAKVHPLKSGNKLTRAETIEVVRQVKAILTQAIILGGTTLKDFQNIQGKPGYFRQALFVYGRKNQPCLLCQEILLEVRLQGRSTVFCPHCQKA